MLLYAGVEFHSSWGFFSVGNFVQLLSELFGEVGNRFSWTINEADDYVELFRIPPLFCAPDVHRSFE